MTRVKICGVTNAPDRDAVVAAGADAVGVVSGVPVETPREVRAAAAADLLKGVPPFATTVLVTMPESVQQAVRLVEHVCPDAVQIHAGLSPAEIGALRRRVDADVLAAVDAEESDVRSFAESTSSASADWERTAEVVSTLDAPVVLAGGLTPANVADAVETVGPFAVDVASGVESEGGRKDHAAVERFVGRAQDAGESAETGAGTEVTT